jgi:F-type H+-transporting ATPase subunit delta
VATAAAKRYARAVFDLAREEGEIEEWEKRLGRISDLFANARVASILSNPTIPAEHRETLVASAPNVLDEKATNLARLLIESGRVGEAAGVKNEYQRLADQAAGRVRATVTTAIELGAADRERLARDLSHRLDKDVRVRAVVDPAILGGLKLQYGDRIVDASVANRLQQLRRRLAAT